MDIHKILIYVCKFVKGYKRLKYVCKFVCILNPCFLCCVAMIYKYIINYSVFYVLTRFLQIKAA